MKHILEWRDWLHEAATTTTELKAPVASKAGGEILTGLSDLGWEKDQWTGWDVGSNFVYKTLEIAKKVFAGSPSDLTEIVALEQKLTAQQGFKREDVDLFGWWVWAIMDWDCRNFMAGKSSLHDTLTNYGMEINELLRSDQNNAYTSSWPWFFKKKWNPGQFFSLVDRQAAALAKVEAKKAKKGETPVTDVAKVETDVAPI